MNELLQGTQRIQQVLYRARTSLRKRQQRQAGMALPMAVITALLVIVGVGIVGTRSLSAWIAQIGQSQNRDARDAAEYGFNQLMARLNQPQNSFLLVTRGNQWGSVTYNELGACGVGVPDSASVTGNTVKGWLGAQNATVVPNSNNSLAWKLTNFTAPELPPGTNQAIGVCTSAIAGKFGNFSGGSAFITIIGESRRADGSVAATYTLKRAVSVIPPEGDAIGNPILLMSTGSKLYGLNGNICQGPPNANSCTTPTKLPLTLVSCVNLADCIDSNLSVIGSSNVAEYCKRRDKKDKTRTYKRNTVCNYYQQAPLLNELPAYPAFNNTTYYGASISDLSLNTINSVKITECEGSAPAKCKFEVDYKTGTDFIITQSYYFPYETTSPPTASSRLLPMCKNTNDGAITCRIDQLHKGSGSPLTVYTRTTNINGVNKPVNLFVGEGGSKPYDSKSFNLDKGIINSALYNANGTYASDASQAWRSLRILSRGFTSSITNACAVKDEIEINDKRSFGVDGAFVWLPDARMTFKKKDRSASYVVAWVCELDGDDKDTDKNAPSVIVTPLQSKDVKAGLGSMFGSSVSSGAGGYYRAKSSSTVEGSASN
jgi:hypothetical protein